MVSEGSFTANDARSYGAAISNRGPLTVMGSVFTDNAVRESGGAVYTTVAAANRIEGSCFTGNTGRFVAWCSSAPFEL